MATNKIAYASPATITCTLASKTSGQGRRGAVVDNSSNLYVGALAQLSILVGTITAPATISLFAYASIDGTTYETGGSSDADWNTLSGDENLIAIIAAPANTTTYTGVGAIESVPKYGGKLPPRWGIIVSQTNCGTLSGTEGNHLKSAVGISYTVA